MSLFTLKENMSNKDNQNFIWIVHPAAERPWLAVGVSLFVVAIGIVSAFYIENIFIGFLAILLFTFGLRSFYFSTTYGVNDDGVIQRTLGQKWGKPWSFFRRYVCVENGVFLSPFVKPSRLDNFRGWFLPVTDKDIRTYIVDKMDDK